ncbi:CPBP family intramembrane glutamic endopeptidase [Nocardia sp. NPDC059180]|uniref:CPBP family intramembrane glutamic endopeptidase n=1 Tax=Nocardia sp. NPDC059180 TaxID=3346761 RepID=UPI0036B5E10B
MGTDVIPRPSLGRFFGLVFALSVPFIALGAAAGTIPGLPNDLPVSALMFVSPALAAVLLVGRAGIGPLLRRTLRIGAARARRWLVIAAAVAPVVSALGYLALRAAGAGEPADDVPWAAVPVFVAAFLLSALGEETGWMGYAVDEMRRRWNLLTTGVLLGIVWGVWHLVPLAQAGRGTSWIAGWFLSTVALRVIIVWLYDASGELILTAILAHASSNVVSSLLPGYLEPATMWAVAVALTVCAAVLTALRPAPGTSGRRPCEVSGGTGSGG